MPTIELDPEVYDGIEGDLDEGETPKEFIGELVSMYETKGRFVQEGYSEQYGSIT